MKNLSSSILFLCFIMPTFSYADCLDLDNTVEIKNCLSKENKIIEAKLSKTYQDLLKNSEGTDKQNLINAQRLWVRFKSADCGAAVEAEGGGTMAGVIGWLCLNDKAKTREKELRNLSTPPYIPVVERLDALSAE